jgi:3-oxoacyl-[acyl-carrier protein] reductase
MIAPIDPIGGAMLVGLIHADQHVQSAKLSNMAIEERYKVLAKEIPIGRVGKAEEVR